MKISEIEGIGSANAKKLEVNSKKKLVRQPPSIKFVEKWIDQAKALEPMVSY